MSTLDPMLLFLVRYLHPQRFLPPFPGVDEKLAATMLGAPLAVYAQAQAHWDQQRDAAVERLLSDATFSDAVDRLPFAAGSTVVGFGDSLTDDCCSWFELLAQAVGRRRPKDAIRFVNAGVSGESTAQMLSRLPFVASLKAQTILCFAGGNDARRFAAATSGTQASPGETVRNLQLAHDTLVQLGGTQWVWLTPIGIDEARAAASPFWAAQGTFWRHADLMAVADRVAELPGKVVDLRNLFGKPMDAELVDHDGLHPTITGQSLLAATVAMALAST